MAFDTSYTPQQLRSACAGDAKGASSSGVAAKETLAVQRATVSISSSQDASVTAACLAAARKRFQIIAARPQTEAAFDRVCTALDIDIISLDLSVPRPPFPLRLQSVAAALRRGVVFEVAYAPAIRDSGRRRATLARAGELVRLTRGRGVVLVSGADVAFEMRGPADVANLGVLIGLRPDAARNAVAASAQDVVDAGSRRAMHKSRVSVHSLGASGETER